MSYTVTKYPQGTFSWADVTSTDIAKSKAFLVGLFGWKAEDMPTEPGKPPYTMFTLDGKNVAGGGPTYAPNMPSMWSSYISVDNVDEMAKKAESLGGKIVMPAMDVMDAGRMVGIADPTGATVFLWQSKKHIGAQLVNTIGAMCWNELYTRDVEKAKKFFSDLFGWTYETDEKSGYVTIKNNNGRMNGGIFAITPEMGQMPPKWMVYFTVKNMEESVKKVKELGGIVYMQKDISVGKIAIVADPTQASIVLMEMSPNFPPTEWME